MTTYTSPDNIPVTETTDLIADSVNNLRTRLNGVATATQQGLSTVRTEASNGDATVTTNAATDATTKANQAKTDAIADATTKYGGLSGRVTKLEKGTNLGTSDLNTILTPGLYYQSNSANATPERNYPFAEAGPLTVLPWADSASNLFQIYYPWLDNTRYALRRVYNGTPGAWETYESVTALLERINTAQAATLAEANAYTDQAVGASGLSDWKTALANQATAAAQVVVFGDSISEGTGTSDVSKRWINILQSKLRYRHGFTTGAQFPFIPTIPKTTATGFPVTRSGAVTVDSSYGLGWRTGILTDATSTVTFTFTGTSAKLLIVKASGTGVMRVVIDGGTPIIFDTNSTRNPPAGTGNNNTWSTGPLTQGAHTITVTRDASSTTGQNVILMGCYTYNGDENSGVRVLDASYHGISSAFLTSSRTTQASNALLTAGPIGLVVIAISTNDYGNNIPPATFKTNIQGLITALRTGAAQYSGSIALVSVYKSDARDETLWQSYEKQLYDIAAADADTAFFDWRLHMPDNPQPYTAPEGEGLFADSLHPNDKGSALIGEFMADYLSL